MVALDPVHRLRRGPIILLLATAITFSFAGFVIFPAAANEKRLWDVLRSGGHVALLRHALAPGTGDPSQFTIGDCSTQRNLSDRGREQAERIGDRFRENGIGRAHVFSSQWCRCIDTANRLKLGPVNELPVLNSFYERPEVREAQSRGLLAWLENQNLSEVHVLVTHQVNVTDLTEVYPGSGELVIVRVPKNGDITVVGTIETD